MSGLSDFTTGGTKPVFRFNIAHLERCFVLTGNLKFITSINGAPSMHTYVKDKTSFVLTLDADESTPENASAYWFSIGK